LSDLIVEGCFPALDLSECHDLHHKRAVTDGGIVASDKTKGLRQGKGRHYPYRARTKAEQQSLNAVISPIIERVTDMLYKLVRRRVRSLLDEDQINEIVQKCRIWIWQKSLPKYNTTYGVKVSTFLYRCAVNFINQDVRAILRRANSRRRIILVDPEVMIQTVQAPSTITDRKIAQVAQDVQDHPEKYLTAAQVQVFKTIMANPGVMKKDLAAQMGYERPSSLSMMMRRIRERILEISVEDFTVTDSPGPKPSRVRGKTYHRA